MLRRLLIVLMLCASLMGAQETDTIVGLHKPAGGARGWTDEVNQNWDLLTQYLTGAKTSPAISTNSITGSFQIDASKITSGTISPLRLPPLNSFPGTFGSSQIPSTLTLQRLQITTEISGPPPVLPSDLATKAYVDQGGGGTGISLGAPPVIGNVTPNGAYFNIMTVIPSGSGSGIATIYQINSASPTVATTGYLNLGPNDQIAFHNTDPSSFADNILQQNSSNRLAWNGFQLAYNSEVPDLGSPPYIGITSPNAARFTTLQATVVTLATSISTPVLTVSGEATVPDPVNPTDVVNLETMKANGIIGSSSAANVLAMYTTPSSSILGPAANFVEQSTGPGSQFWYQGGGGIQSVSITTNGPGAGFWQPKLGTSGGNPPSGTCKFYVDSTTNVLTGLNSAGGSCLPASIGGSSSASSIQSLSADETTPALGDIWLNTTASRIRSFTGAVDSQSNKIPRTLAATTDFDHSSAYQMVNLPKCLAALELGTTSTVCTVMIVADSHAGGFGGTANSGIGYNLFSNSNGAGLKDGGWGSAGEGFAGNNAHISTVVLDPLPSGVTQVADAGTYPSFTNWTSCARPHNGGPTAGCTGGEAYGLDDTQATTTVFNAYQGWTCSSCTRLIGYFLQQTGGSTSVTPYVDGVAQTPVSASGSTARVRFDTGTLTVGSHTLYFKKTDNNTNPLAVLGVFSLNSTSSGVLPIKAECSGQRTQDALAIGGTSDGTWLKGWISEIDAHVSPIAAALNISEMTNDFAAGVPPTGSTSTSSYTQTMLAAEATQFTTDGLYSDVALISAPDNGLLCGGSCTFTPTQYDAALDLLATQNVWPFFSLYRHTQPEAKREAQGVFTAADHTNLTAAGAQMAVDAMLPFVTGGRLPVSGIQPVQAYLTRQLAGTDFTNPAARIIEDASLSVTYTLPNPAPKNGSCLKFVTSHTAGGITFARNGLAVNANVSTNYTLGADQSAELCSDGANYELLMGAGSSSGTTFATLGGGTNTAAAMVVGTGASLTIAGTGTINSTSMLGSNWASPGALGTTAPNTAVFRSLSVPFLGVAGTGVVTAFQINSASANISISAYLNLARADNIGMRNWGNTADNIIGEDSSDRLTWNSHELAYLSEISGGGSPAFSSLTAAVGNLSLNNGNNLITMNAAQSSNNQSAWTFGESSPASGTGQIGVNIQTAATSTAVPFQVTAQGPTNGVQLTTAGVFQKVGAGHVNADECQLETCVQVITPGTPGFLTKWNGTGTQLLNTTISDTGSIAGTTIDFYVQDLDDSTFHLPVIKPVGVASAVDYLQITNSAAANPATITVEAAGADANININFVSKGTGTIKCNGSTCGTGGGSQSSYQISGSTSGVVTLESLAVAGTPTVIFGNGSGTPAVSATAPLAINATTGNLSLENSASANITALIGTDTSVPTGSGTFPDGAIAVGDAVGGVTGNSKYVVSRSTGVVTTDANRVTAGLGHDVEQYGHVDTTFTASSTINTILQTITLVSSANVVTGPYELKGTMSELTTGNCTTAGTIGFQLQYTDSPSSQSYTSSNNVALIPEDAISSATFGNPILGATLGTATNWTFIPKTVYAKAGTAITLVVFQKTASVSGTCTVQATANVSPILVAY